MDLKKEFQKYGIDTFGVCDASLYNEKTGADYKSCIVALFPYFCGYPENSNISIYTHGTDYHLVASDILKKVASGLELSGFEVFSDTGPHIERRLCVKAGLGFVGRNGMCINQKYGSYFFVGYIVCNEALTPSSPCESKCIGCMRCVKACPGNALSDGFKADRCLSKITQKRGGLTEDEAMLIKKQGTVFGCDICQKVCPHNSDVSCSDIPAFTQGRITRLTLSDIEPFSNREFKERYKDRAFSWRGKNVLKRNLKITESGDIAKDEDSNT